MPKEVQLYTLKSDIRDRHLGQASLSTVFARIRKETGLSPFRVLREWFPYYRKPNRLRFDEYIYFGLFDSEKYSTERKRRFVSESRNNQLWLEANDISWVSAAEDKWLMYSLLERHGIPTPETLAIFPVGGRDFGSLPTVSGSDQLRDLFVDNGSEPLFLKPVKGVGSSGVQLVAEVSETHVTLSDGRTIPTSQFVADAIGEDDYLIQRVVKNHDDIGKLSSHLATVRLYNLSLGGDVRVVTGLMKLCAEGNVADNFWRTGNLLAGLDLDSGRITRVIRGSGFDKEELETCPLSGVKFSDVTVPHWEAVKTLNERCARMYSGLLFSSTDIALTNEGPVVIEVNNGGAVNLPQLVYEEGFMTDDAARFFEEAAQRK